MYCDHSKPIGDNYGISCQRCGQVLEGFGYGRFGLSVISVQKVPLRKVSEINILHASGLR